MKKILFIIGSLRNNGFNYQLSKEVYEILKDKYEISYLEYSNITYMNQDLENPELEIIKNIRIQIIYMMKMIRMIIMKTTIILKIMKFMKLELFCDKLMLRILYMILIHLYQIIVIY